MNEYDVIIIGGGASGMYAAIHAARSGEKVLLLEKNKRLGEKLRITGGGRCNITNAEFDTRLLLKNYGTAEKFLYSLFAKHSVQDTIEFFESYGLPIVVEDRKRAFPASHKAEDVVALLEKQLHALQVDIRTRSNVHKITIENNFVSSIKVDQTIYRSKRYIFSTGSISHPETGSTGDGFKWLRDAGHRVINPTPDIVPLASSDTWIHALSGTKLTDSKITFSCDSVKQFSVRGDILCTHFGISGPLILNNARAVAGLLQSGLVTAEIDLYPSEDLGSLQRRILGVFEANKNKTLKNILGEFVPSGSKKGVQTLLGQSTDLETKVHSVSKDARLQIARLLKAMPLTIDGLMGFDKAVIADGGLDITEVNFKTMQSRIISNLHVTGDLIHINRPSGGYSLQLCWSTGYVAGTAK